jgi:hypothetical protein
MSGGSEGYDMRYMADIGFRDKFALPSLPVWAKIAAEGL